MRKLATIQKISEIKPIEGADKIELAFMKNVAWQVVVKKGEFKIGDIVIYCEIDSILPEKQEFEFLRSKKFRIKTIKLKGVLSQGIIFPISFLKNTNNLQVGQDLTDEIGIKKYDPQIEEDRTLNSKQKQNGFVKLLMRIYLFRKIYLYLFQQKKGNWPSWIAKTDEDRIQVCAKTLMNNFDKKWYVTEKLDGSSGTVFCHVTKRFGFKKKIYGICSRNIWLKTPDNKYWFINEKYNILNKLKKYGKDIVIQGELIGPKIQKNKYKLEQMDFRVFTIIEGGIRVGYNRMLEICKILGLQTVPIIYLDIIPQKLITDYSDTRAVVNTLLGLAEGKSMLENVEREGLVWRLIDNPNVSFKAISNKFLLENGE